ncbi:MAG: 6,7-dimethyl-8-ribityllumazine synthase [Verrucomicrobia bacterium]|nr:6,7-dimethyl-8-ribityllumazine synthase [Verrucomicrobiota bacterium]
MLKKHARNRKKNALPGVRFAIVASKYNRRYVDGMLQAAKAALVQAGAREIEVVRVPGAFEIPVVAARLAAHSRRPFSAILCLGVILRGETTHAQHIGEAVSQALVHIQVAYHIPVIHEVLLLENEAQAQARCLSKTHNRGEEAAGTALEMARTMAALLTL